MKNSICDRSRGVASNLPGFSAAMKPARAVLLLVVLVLATPAAAQHYVGVRGGVGGGYGRFYPKPSESGTVWGLYDAGVSWKYYSPERFVGGIEADVLFFQQGYRTYELAAVPEGSNEKGRRLSYYQRTVNSIMVPVYWQSHVYLFMRHMRVFLNLGVTLSYNYSSREESHSYETGETTSGKYPLMLTRDNPLTYGLGGGLGVGWSFGRLEILAEGRYYFGYGDILRNRNKYELNPMRSPLDNIQIDFGVYWRLGKGGILSAPGPKMEAKLREIERRRLEEKLKEDERQIGDLEKEIGQQESQLQSQQSQDVKPQ